MTSDVRAATQFQRVAAQNPEAELEALLSAPEPAGCARWLAVDFEFCEYWKDEGATVALTALFHVAGGSISIAVLPTEQFDACEKNWRAGAMSLDELRRALPVDLLALDAPMLLQSIAIPKPWGREIWYTGIEKRGVAMIGSAARAVPLPWLLAVAPQRLTRGARQPILLKILDPLPQAVFGDLYFELHRQKQEVYVVTAVDRQAWPDGIGGIRFGFDAEVRTQYGNDEEFVGAYLAAVRAYRQVRKQIDGQIDALRLREGVEVNAPVEAGVLQRWLEEIPVDLRAREAELRAHMDSFTALLPLRVGDVVKVPCLLPHSLQHGVRTVEFQTPVYERLILSFAQKVLTQADWDTEEAASILQLAAEPAAAFPLIAEGDGWKEERIVQFDDFEVRRISLQPGARMRLGLERGYGLGMVVGQPLRLGDRTFAPDEAVLLPAQFGSALLQNSELEAGYFLLAMPLL